MADRKRTPDILEDLLGGAHTPRPEDTSIPVRAQAPAEAKLKATYYLSSEALDALDHAWIMLRKITKSKAQISKSLIVEKAILLAVEELADKGAKSRLASKVAPLS